jgi:serine/threonine protein phosphatase 1
LCENDHGKVAVRGEVEIHLNRINIDTGAHATGPLTCVVIEGETIEVL